MGAYSETSMCGLFLGRSFSALFLSFQCSCFQQLSGLNHLFTISCESHPRIVSVWAVGLFLTARASSQLSSRIYRTGSCFCLIFTASHYQKQTLGWVCSVAFVDTWPHVQLSGRWRRRLSPHSPETRVGHHDWHSNQRG